MKHSTSEHSRIAAAAKKLLGFDSLRPGQEPAIECLLHGRDTVVVQRTGSGKSAIYQIAGALLEGPTLVVSPLIALQKDQADAIESSRLQNPAVVNSLLPASEQREAIERIEQGHAKYVFLAPEQLRKEETIQILQDANVSLIAIDEAHCVSQWGYDFRPDYLELNRVIEALGHPPTLAMTATASPEVRKDIVEKLGLKDPLVLVRGFDRPNISLRVDKFANKDEKFEALLRRVEFADKPGIVYVGTHKNAEFLAGELLARGVEAVFYHGGRKAKDREAIQNRFMEGTVPVIVATNAFGMGVDKPDIRFVYHADVSDSLDAYYQEIGRAGRDDKPAEAVLFFTSRDIGAQQYKTGTGRIDTRDLETVLNALAQSNKSIDRDELAKSTISSTRKLANLIHRLEWAGAVTQSDSGAVKLARNVSMPETIERVVEQQEFQKESRKRRLQQVREYIETTQCRREFLLRYFGDDYTGPCDNCDRCEAAGVALPKIA